MHNKSAHVRPYLTVICIHVCINARQILTKPVLSASLHCLYLHCCPQTNSYRLLSTHNVIIYNYLEVYIFLYGTIDQLNGE